jgi:hypothetical protein
MNQNSCESEETVLSHQEARNGNGPNGSGSAGNGLGLKGHSPMRVEIPTVEPWLEPVNGAELLDAIRKELARFVVFPKWGAEVFALWILHTFGFRLREVTTYVGIESPEKECGKSTLVTVLSRLANRALVSSNISPSAFYRAIEELGPTLIIDEADTNLRGKDDLRGILNAGYTRPTAFVWRMCYDSSGAESDEAKSRAASGPGRVARYSCWCPKAIATIGPLHPTLASRCIVIRMQRKLGNEECERLKWLEAGELQRKCARFVLDHGEEITKGEPEIPRGLTNRAADVWEPLLVLADLAGGHWPGLAREAALGLTARAQEHSPIGSLLLDILVAFTELKRGRVFSRELAVALERRGDRPWLELRRGKRVTEAWLAQRLRPYGIKSRTIRIGEEVSRGYLEGEMIETFRRYIPRAEVAALNAELSERTEAASVVGCQQEATERREGETSSSEA